MSEPPSNWKAANEADPENRFIIGRAFCPRCQTVRAYVARVDVEDLACECGALCVLGACGDEDPRR